MNPKNVMVISTAVLTRIATASAADKTSHSTEVHPPHNHEGGAFKCTGIALQFINSCSANGHGCASMAQKDWDEHEWLSLADKKACDNVLAALKQEGVKEYVELVRDQAVAAAKQGKFGDLR